MRNLLRTRLPVLLAVLTVACGGFAVRAGQNATAVRDAPAARNAALTDNAGTSEVKGQVTAAVQALFSCDYLDLEKTRRAAVDLLTGGAKEQYEKLFGPVRAAAPDRKLVLTTTVTDSAVRTLEGGRARLLVFADQVSTTAADGKSTYAAAMLGVEAVRRDGRWRISALDTLGG